MEMWGWLLLQCECGFFQTTPKTEKDDKNMRKERNNQNN